MYTKVRTFLILGLFLLMLGGCNAFSNNGPVVTPLVSPSATPTSLPVASPTISYKLNSDDVQAYIISGTDFSKQAVMFEAETDLPLSEVIEMYFDTIEDEGFYIRITDAYFKDDGAYIDFNSRYYPGSVASDYEKELLDCIAQTILENYKDIKEVYYLINGSDYVTDKINLEGGKCYISK